MFLRTAVLATLLSAVLLLMGCPERTDAPAQPATGEPAAPSAGETAKVERPKPFATPEEAFHALFEAVQSGDKARLAGVLLSHEECLAMTGAEERCREMRLRNAAFLATQSAKALPPDARLADIVLLRSFEVPTGGSADRAPTKIQLGHLRIVSRFGASRLSNVGAISVEGGWRIIPGRAVLPERDETIPPEAPISDDGK